MKCLDIVVPQSHFSVLSHNDSFTLVLPTNDPRMDSPNLHTLIRMIALSESDYQNFVNLTDTPISPLAINFFDIDYIRECRAKSVIDAEWSQSYGPSTLKDFVNYHQLGETGADEPVKIYYLKRPKPNLTRLNREYSPKMRRNG